MDYHAIGVLLAPQEETSMLSESIKAPVSRHLDLLCSVLVAMTTKLPTHLALHSWHRSHSPHSLSLVLF